MTRVSVSFVRGLVAPALLLCLQPWPQIAAAAAPAVDFERAPGQVRISIGGEPFAVYVLADPATPRPYFKHLHAPSGVQVTRNHPPAPEDKQDHPLFHPGLWLAFGDLDGHDYWRLKAKIVHEAFTRPPRGGPGHGEFTVRNRYLSTDGQQTVCLQQCRFQFCVLPSGYLIVWDSTFRSEMHDFAFGDQEEMGLGVRMATPIAVDEDQGGRIIDSQGRVNGKQVWGEKADWCDYSGTVDGQRVGVTLMPDPKNFRPCWSHARDYGFLAVNPFGREAMTGGPKSRVVVKKGEPFHLRYGVLVHDGAPGAGYDARKGYHEFLELIGQGN